MTVNKNIVNEICSDRLVAEITEYLNAVIDEELLKDDIDTDLIDECIEALDSLNSNDLNPALKLVLTEKQVIKYCKKQTGKANKLRKQLAAACVILAVSSSIMILNTNTAFANEVKDIFRQIIEALNFTAEESVTDPAKEISSIYGVFPAKASFTVKSKDDIDLSTIRVIAVYKDGSESVIPISDCTVNITENFGGDPNSVLVAVGYNGCAFSIKYTIGTA